MFIPGYGFHPMDFVILLAFALSLWAQFRVKGTFNKFTQFANSRELTGYEAARRMLDENGLHDVPIQAVRGSLTDHYDPIRRTVNLSEPVYGERSISAIAVACHEVGHAIQHKVKYPMLVVRHRIFPLVNLSSGIAPLLILAGFLLQFWGLAQLGVILFSIAVAFQLMTLPVEFNASSRAKLQMVQLGFIDPREEGGVSKVLNAAALTYVAAALISLLQLLKFIMILTSNNRN